MIEDGYTETLGDIQYRRMLSSEKSLFFETARGLTPEECESVFFASPRVILPAGRVLSEEEKCRLFFEITRYKDEQSDWENLTECSRIAFTNPLLFIRTCTLCSEYWFDHETGRIPAPDGNPLRRPKHAVVPCKAGQICEKGTIDNPITLSRKNRQAFNHWLKWRHVGAREVDATLQRNWNFFGDLKDKHGISGTHQAVNRLLHPG